MSEERKELLEYVSSVTELNDMSNELQDELLDDALGYIIKLTVKDVPAQAAAPLIVKLQAMSAQFKMKAKYYMHFKKGTENAGKKNAYLSMSEELDKLVSALKYTTKNF